MLQVVGGVHQHAGHVEGIEPAATEDAESDLRLQAERCIEQVLRSSGGNMAEAARRLGISRNTLYRKLKTRQNFV